MGEDGAHRPSGRASIIAGGLAGAIAKSTIAPLDRTKINFQVSTVYPYSVKAALKFISRTYRKDGLLALWRGNSATLVRVVPYAAFQFSAHEQFTYLLGVDRHGKTPGRRFAAGALAGFTSTFVFYPLDSAKARLSISTRAEYTGIWDFFVKTWRQRELMSLYRGFFPSLVGVSLYAGMTFSAFGTLRQRWKEFYGEDPNPLVRGGLGAVAGVIGQSTSYPLDIVKRRRQTGKAPPGMNALQLLLHIGRSEGYIRGLFKGLSMNWIKGPISAACSFGTYSALYPYLTARFDSAK